MQRVMKKVTSMALILTLLLSVFPQMMFASTGSSSKEFLSFSVEGNPGVVNNEDHTINVIVPFRSAVNNMLESFTVSDGASVLNHMSDLTRTDYSSPRTLTVVAEDNSTQDYTVTVTIGPSSLKSMTSFNADQAVSSFIDDEAYLIYLYVPQGTNITALTPTFTTDDSGAQVLVNGAAQTSGTSPQDFSNPVTYTVKALDGSTRDYLVTVNYQTEPSTAKEMTYFGLASLSSVGMIDESNHTIALTVPYGTDLTMLVPSFTSTGTRVTITNGTQQVSGENVVDFSSPVEYLVYDEAGNAQSYMVIVQEAAAGASTTKEIQTFSLDGVAGTVNEETHTISVVLPFDSSRDYKVASFTTNGQFVKIGSTLQVSGTTENDFTDPQTYTVFAENGLTQNYVVTVSLAEPPSPAKELTSFQINNLVGVVDQVNHTVTITVPYGTNVTQLTPIFMSTGLDVKVGLDSQVSGVTTQDFTSPVTYTVHAADGTIQDYVVTVTAASQTPSNPNPSVPTEPKPSSPTFKSVFNQEKLEAYLKSKVEQALKNPSTGVFSDVNGHWGKSNIDLFVKLGLIIGYQDDTFRPNASITRAEFAAMMVRVFNFDTSSSTKTFSDVKDNYWASQDIKALAASGIITGYTDGAFRPNEVITRAEIIAMISRIVDFKAVGEQQTVNFNDIASSWNANDIRSAASAGIINGRAEGVFAPQEQSTRAEALSIILRVLNLNPEIKALLDQLKS
ncbi:S-layer homology domain-containing protein [Paenibacillus sp. YAF4_2]|uniref:S-layer homology domain-containing protein n=1 Tax=Paenibacillus sp. YAF4_2 TaxID=3233085 RepID=UPI003F9490A0